MPLVTVKKMGQKYRLVNADTGRLALSAVNGVVRDGGGHKGKATAIRQAGYINNALKQKGA